MAVVARLMNTFGPKRLGAVVSDNGGACEKGRRLTKEAFSHLVIQRYSAWHKVASIEFVSQWSLCRYMMHGLHSLRLSLWSQISCEQHQEASEVVTLTKSSHKLKHWVHEEYLQLRKHSPKHKKLTWLEQAATTRFLSTYNCMLPVQQLEVAFKTMADKHQAKISKDGTACLKAVLEIVREKRFWRELSLTPLKLSHSTEMSCSSIPTYGCFFTCCLTR